MAGVREKLAVDRATLILRRAEDVHQPVHHLAHVHRALVSAHVFPPVSGCSLLLDLTFQLVALVVVNLVVQHQHIPRQGRSGSRSCSLIPPCATAARPRGPRG